MFIDYCQARTTGWLYQYAVVVKKTFAGRQCTLIGYHNALDRMFFSPLKGVLANTLGTKRRGDACYLLQLNGMTGLYSCLK